MATFVDLCTIDALFCKILQYNSPNEAANVQQTCKTLEAVVATSSYAANLWKTWFKQVPDFSLKQNAKCNCSNKSFDRFMKTESDATAVWTKSDIKVDYPHDNLAPKNGPKRHSIASYYEEENDHCWRCQYMYNAQMLYNWKNGRVLVQQLNVNTNERIFTASILPYPFQYSEPIKLNSNQPLVAQKLSCLGVDKNLDSCEHSDILITTESTEFAYNLAENFDGNSLFHPKDHSSITCNLGDYSNAEQRAEKYSVTRSLSCELHCQESPQAEQYQSFKAPVKSLSFDLQIKSTIWNILNSKRYELPFCLWATGRNICLASMLSPCKSYKSQGMNSVEMQSICSLPAHLQTRNVRLHAQSGRLVCALGLISDTVHPSVHAKKQSKRSHRRRQNCLLSTVSGEYYDSPNFNLSPNTFIVYNMQHSQTPQCSLSISEHLVHDFQLEFEFSESGQILIGFDSTIGELYAWTLPVDFQTYGCIEHALVLANAHPGGILCADINNDLNGGCRILTGGRNEQIGLYSLDTLSRIHTFTGHQAEVSAVRFLREGSWADDKIRDKCSSTVASCWPSQLCISGAYDGELILWDMRIADKGSSSGRISTLLEHQARIVTIDAAAWKGQFLLSGDNDGFLKLWDMRKLSESVLTRHFNGAIVDVQSNNGFGIVRCAAKDRDLLYLLDFTNPF